MHADVQLWSSLEHRGFAALRIVPVAFEPALDPSFPFVVHNWSHASGKEEGHLAGVQGTYCCTLEELGCAAVADTGSFALRKQIGRQIELAPLERLFAC